MTLEQSLILLVLVVAMGMFIWGRWRHDMVALGALLACVFLGLVPADIAFNGFGHPAVITVACVLVLSSALQSSGAVDVLAQRVLPKTTGPTFSIAALTGAATLMSAFMNNVGAMALLMPIAIQLASRLNIPPGRVLMPVSFGTILGGMTTLIGTPPNLIVSGFRSEQGDAGFGMFAFTPVGATIAISGVFLLHSSAGALYLHANVPMHPASIPRHISPKYACKMAAKQMACACMNWKRRWMTMMPK